jgi:hypothetical protein
MRKLIVFLTCVTSFVQTYGQSLDFAIIADKDGFVQVRKSKELIDTNIIDKLQNGFVINYLERDGYWINIRYEREDKEFSGFIFRDRLKDIYSFMGLQGRSITTNEFKLSNKSIEITISDKNFVAGEHSIINKKDQKSIIDLIDGKEMFGTGGALPQREYKSIDIKINGVKISMPKEALQNLYEPTIEYTVANYDDKSQTLYIRSDNSEGSASYAVIWVIEKGKFKQRCVGVVM